MSIDAGRLWCMTERVNNLRIALKAVQESAELATAQLTAFTALYEDDQWQLTQDKVYGEDGETT
jgi:hypothetical protein